MKRTWSRLLAAVLAAGLCGAAGWCAAAGGAHWSYSGATGPAKWSALDRSFGLCKSGTVQSPINIPEADVRKGDLPSLLFNYKPSPVRIIDNDHTIQVNYAPGSFVTVSGKQYELVRIEFHKPSEIKVSGKDHEMGIHLIHQDKEGKLAVVAVFVDPGKESAVIKTLWSNLPQAKDKENVVDAAKINAFELLPSGDKGYYSFPGSLTTPPCTENVAWFVVKTPIQLSNDQIARFAKLYPMNARPVQPLNDRDLVGTR
jgi:carbonic anhydrase